MLCNVCLNGDVLLFAHHLSIRPEFEPNVKKKKKFDFTVRNMYLFHSAVLLLNV